MVEVAGEPFIAHQLRLLAREGVTDVVICAGHLGDQVKAFVADGSAFGCQVRYSFDGDILLGTGGALRRALPLLGKRFFVMYGDSYLDTRFRPIYDAFLRAKKSALMTVFCNANRWDTSNIEFVNGTIRRYDKVNRTQFMRYIDYGLGILDAGLLMEREPNDRFDLADFYRELISRELLAGYEIEDRFYEIGSPSGLAETDAFLRRDAVTAAKPTYTSHSTKRSWP